MDVGTSGSLVPSIQLRRRTDMPRKLPKRLKRLFWEYEFCRLNWERHKNLVTSRILSHGGWEDIKWLRRRVGDDTLRKFIIHRRGADLSPKQLRFWEFILDLPHEHVNQWLAAEERKIWDQRTRRRASIRGF